MPENSSFRMVKHHEIDNNIHTKKEIETSHTHQKIMKIPKLHLNKKKKEAKNNSQWYFKNRVYVCVTRVNIKISNNDSIAKK